MNRSAIFALLAASVATGAQAHTYTDNARVIGYEPQYESVNVPREVCRSDWVGEARRPVGRDYGGAVIGGLAGALLGNQVGHGREAATAVGAVIGAFTGDNVVRRNHWEQPNEPVRREVQTCRTVYDVQSRVVGYRVDYDYNGQRLSTVVHDEPGRFLPVRVSVEAVGR